MIIEFLVEAGLSLFDLIISLLPDIEFTGLNTAIDYMFNVLNGVCYFLPMGTVRAIFSIIYSLFTFRLFIAILRSLWSMIPIL